MASKYRFEHTYHVGETATPFAVRLLDSAGQARVDIDTCEFRLQQLNVPDDGHPVILIGWVACQSVALGVCSYSPSPADMAIAVTFGDPLAVLAQFKATLINGDVLPTDYVVGVIEANVDASD